MDPPTGSRAAGPAAGKGRAGPDLVAGASAELCGVVLAAGAGTRLRPLTLHRPKALCPVGNVTLLDRTLARLERVGLAGPGRVAVNACHLAEQIAGEVTGRARLSVESPPALGTSGALARLRDWIDGRAVLACNADAYLAPIRTDAPPPVPDPAGALPPVSDPAGAPVPDPAGALPPVSDPVGAPVPDPTGALPPVPELANGWDGETVRVLVVAAAPGTGEFGEHREWRFAGVSLLPWRVVRGLPDRAGELVLTAWRPAEAAGELEAVPYRGVFFDCGTPADYLAANRHAAGGGNLLASDATVEPPATVEESVVGAGATVAGSISRCVVWPGGYVARGEKLVAAVRIGRDITVPAEQPAAPG